jgi:hypothetical protein
MKITLKKNGPMRKKISTLKMNILSLKKSVQIGPKYEAVCLYLFEIKAFMKKPSVQKMDRKTDQKTDRSLFCKVLVCNCLQFLFPLKRTDLDRFSGVQFVGFQQVSVFSIGPFFFNFFL